MYILPRDRDNESWAKVISQFEKGGFDWYKDCMPHSIIYSKSSLLAWREWYYKCFLSSKENRMNLCLSVAERSNQVTWWLRNIHKFEDIKEKYERIKILPTLEENINSDVIYAFVRNPYLQMIFYKFDSKYKMERKNYLKTIWNRGGLIRKKKKEKKKKRKRKKRKGRK
jgi:hypothetical protein